MAMPPRAIHWIGHDPPGPPRREAQSPCARRRRRYKELLRERGVSMQTPHVNQTAWNGNNRTFAWDHLKLAHSLLDPEALEIFRSTCVEEMTAIELSRRCGMSTGRCYDGCAGSSPSGFSFRGKADRRGVECRPGGIGRRSSRSA